MSEENALALEAIEDGVKQWTSKTCITFKERTDEKAFIYFFVGGRYVKSKPHPGGRGWGTGMPLKWTRISISGSAPPPQLKNFNS